MHLDLQAQTAKDKSAEEKFFAALTKHGAEQYQSFLEGVALYHASAFCRDMAEPPCLWQKGTTRLLDFAPSQESVAPVVLVIPSLINRYHVLDVDGTQSFMRGMAAAGLHPMLVDWGVPNDKERSFDINAYMQQRLLPALRVAVREAHGPVHVAGYCMGGLLAVALAQLAKDDVKSLLCLASPWDFHEGDEGLTALIQATHEKLDALIDLWGELPVDVLQSYFISLSPFSLLDKFVRFSKLRQNSAEARAFVLKEDWVNDGVPLAKGVAKDCLDGWYMKNTPACGTWQVMGEAIKPKKLNLPNLHIIPQHDKIVPPASALSLAKAMKISKILKPACGHVSMMTGCAARDKLWPVIFDWLASQHT